jgi:hypothetical protein
MTSDRDIDASLVSASAAEKVSPSWIEPKDAGRRSSSDVDDRSLSVFGCPSRGAEPCNERGDDVERAEKAGEDE